MTADLSVVVPSVNGWADLRSCLAALRADSGALEVIVVDRVGDDVRRPLAREFPDAILILAVRTDTIPQMRAAAIDRATAPLVAIIEDHVIVPRGWARAMIAAQRQHGGVVAGLVSNVAVDRLVDCAAFYCEYSRLLPPKASGRTDWLPGNNTIYPRDVLETHRDLVNAGRWEDFLHHGLREAGVPLTSCPEIVAGHKKHYTVCEYTSQRFLYARAFAGDRVAARAWPIRLAYGAGALVLPPILFLRTLGRAWTRPEQRARLIQSIPLIGLFVCAWGAGEAVGYSLGPGDALSRVC